MLYRKGWEVLGGFSTDINCTRTNRVSIKSSRGVVGVVVRACGNHRGERKRKDLSIDDELEKMRSTGRAGTSG